MTWEKFKGIVEPLILSSKGEGVLAVIMKRNGQTSLAFINFADKKTAEDIWEQIKKRAINGKIIIKKLSDSAAAAILTPAPCQSLLIIFAEEILKIGGELFKKNSA